MTTQKQIEANRMNAQLSTGPISEEGKSIVAQNAIQHGIFTRDLIINTGDGKEDPTEYHHLLTNLIDNLFPKGQLEYLLVEKIAVDFWRLRRVLRFETGSIRKYLDMVIYDHYNKKDYGDKNEHKTNTEIDEEIKQQQSYLGWNKNYIKALKSGAVTFEKPKWSNEQIETDIVDDLYDVIRTNQESFLKGDENGQFENGELELKDLLEILQRSEYSDKKIAAILIAKLEKQNKTYEKEITDLEQRKIKNNLTEEVIVKTRALPHADDAEKVMRYENALQKSILRNLAILKKLQELV